MPCPSDDTLARFAQGLLTPAELDAFEPHLADCPDCVRVVGELASQDDFTDQEPTVGLDLAIVRRGASVGRYIVLDLLGSGGMGRVYTGYDPLLDRKVALKLLRPATGDTGGVTPQGSSRLLREAQALARVSHPNVVAIYDVGTVGDQVFMAFERVEGSSLGSWLKQRRAWREIRDAFVEAGRGLAAAHAAGVVHRDFKPDNVLVGRDGRIRVTDFGLARARRDPAEQDSSSTSNAAPGNTVDGAVGGTPGFIAPEVLAGLGADARSDQFSFCVALYESLYCVKPFALADLAKGDGPSPQARTGPNDARVPARLRRALQRGLERRPEDRFPSMEALLDALLRDPVRRAAPFAAAGLGLCVVAGVLAGAHHMVDKQARQCQGAAERLSPVWNDARRTTAHGAFRATGLPYAADAWRTTEDLLTAYVSGWTSMRTDACEATRVRGEQSAEALDLRMACLDRSARDLGLLVEMLETADAKVVENAAFAAARLPPLAACADVEALRRPQRPPANPSKRSRLEELRAGLARAEALLSVGKADAARKLASAEVAEAHDLAYRPVEAEALFVLGNAESEAGDYPAAARSLHGAALAAEVGHELRLEALSYVRLAMVVGPVQRQFDQGELFSAHVRACLEQLGDDAAVNAELLDVEAQLAYLAGHLEDSLSKSQKAMAILERAKGADDRRLAALRSAAGFVLADSNRFPEAVEFEERALADRRQMLGAAHPEVARSLTNLALVHARLGETEQALGEFRQAEATWTSALGSEHPLVGFAKEGAADALMELGRVDEAERTGEAALEIMKKGYGPEHPRVASAYDTLGQIELELGKLDEAQRDFERALALLEAPGSNPMRQGQPLVGLGKVLLARQRPREALVPLERAVGLLEKLEGYGNDRAAAHLALASALWESRTDPTRSMALAKLALGEVQQLPPSRSPRRQIEAWLAAHPEPTP